MPRGSTAKARGFRGRVKKLDDDKRVLTLALLEGGDTVDISYGSVKCLDWNSGGPKDRP